MTYNDTEYAILTALGFGLKGKPAIEFIKEHFQLDIPIATYWRHLGKLEATFPIELEHQMKTVIQKHIARLHMFYNNRTILLKALEDEETPYKKAKIAMDLAKHEVYIAQLEGLSRKYFEMQSKEILDKAREAMPMLTV